MTSDLVKLMETISMLQSEPTPEPILESNEPTVHPLLQAMQELREEGIVDEYVNKDTVTPGFKKEKWIMGGKYKLVATARDRKNDKDAEGLIIKVIDPEDTSVFRPGEVGSVRLIVKGDGSYDDKKLSASLLGVDDDHQRKGLASAMYQFARELGNDIMPSNAQTDMGKSFWQGGAGVGKDFPEELPSQPEVKQEPVEPEAKKSFWKRLFKEDELEEYNIRKTKKFIQRAHDQEQGQLYGDMPYSSHPKQVANLGKKFFGPKFNYEASKVALLHDILEDTPYTPEQLAKKGFSKEVIQAVQLLTKDKSLSYADNIRNIINSGNVLAMMVKYCDNYMNYSGDKSHWSPDRAAHSQKKYLASLNMLGDVLGIKKHVGEEPDTEKVAEASPNTLEGSFTPDLVESKTWLCDMLAKGLKGKNAGTIYVLGSWYGNMGIFLQQAGVQFDKLVLVEPDEEALMRSKDLLQQIGDEGKLILIHQKAEDVVYEKPGVVINTSCNETGPVFLTKLPDNMLCLLQARNNNETTLFPTEDEEDFIDYFPLEKVYYTGKKQLEDPEVNYVRYMKIGRTGKTLDEAITTGQGGGSAGVGGGQMVGGPTTYEQEYDMFKSKGPRRIISMTEALDSSYPYEFKNNAYYFITDAGNDYKVVFKGDKKVEVSFMARGENDQPKDDITGTGDSRKVFGTVINIVKDYVGQHQPDILMFAADNNESSRIRLYNMLASQAGKALPGYNFVKTLKGSLFTTFYLTRDNIKVPKLDTVKNVAGRVLDKAFEGRP